MNNETHPPSLPAVPDTKEEDDDSLVTLRKLVEAVRRYHNNGYWPGVMDLLRHSEKAIEVLVLEKKETRGREKALEERNELRVKVALLLGHKWVRFIVPELGNPARIFYQLLEPRHLTQDWWKRQGGVLVEPSQIPDDAEKSADTDHDWPNDLNACARLRIIASANGRAKQYVDNLSVVITADSFTGDMLASDFDLIDASASQHCRAFIATMEK
jgi:hypothetical protein